MKKKLFFALSIFLLVFAFSFSSCKKDDTNPTFELRFTNTSSNPYLVEVDGNSNILSGNTYKSYQLEKGTYAWKVTQQSGYVLFPTVKEGTVNLNTDKEIVFP